MPQANLFLEKRKLKSMKCMIFIADDERSKTVPFFPVECYRIVNVYFYVDVLHGCSTFGFHVSDEDAYNIREQDGCISGQAKDRETQRTWLW
jgi:hypothetical protein